MMCAAHARSVFVALVLLPAALAASCSVLDNIYSSNLRTLNAVAKRSELTSRSAGISLSRTAELIYADGNITTLLLST